MYLLIFEFLGTNELLVILVVALILLGPRRLPQMSRKIGKSLAEFKRTSEEFKRTWEKEVDMESLVKDDEPNQAILSPQTSIPSATIERGGIAGTLSGSDLTEVKDENAVGDVPPPSVTPVDASVMRPLPDAASDQPAITSPTRKQDWL